MNILIFHLTLTSRFGKFLGDKSENYENTNLGQQGIGDFAKLVVTTLLLASTKPKSLYREVTFAPSLSERFVDTTTELKKVAKPLLWLAFTRVFSLWLGLWALYLSHITLLF